MQNDQPWWAEHQRREAEQFKGTRQAEIAAAEEVVRQSLAAYLAAARSAGADAELCKQISSRLSGHSGRWPYLAPLQLGLAGSLPSLLFWHAADAIGFLVEATGIQWPYFTQDERSRYLAWAVDEAQMLSLRLNRHLSQGVAA